MRKIKVVVLLVQQLQHGFTKNAKVSPNLTVAHILTLFYIARCHHHQIELARISMTLFLNPFRSFVACLIMYSDGHPLVARPPKFNARPK